MAAKKKKTVADTATPVTPVMSRIPVLDSPVIYLGDFSGIQFVGDPHVFPKPIGRRNDDFLASVLGKLEFAAEKANRENLLTICLGDLFHREGVNALVCLNRLVVVLNKFATKMVVLDGNHDRSSPALTEQTALQLLVNTERVRVPVNVGLSYRASINGILVDIHMYPHGVPIPHKVPQSQNPTIAITHHDLAFGGAYPGSQPLKSILGIDMVVNGHMHDTKESELHGATYWHNPGNIEPLSIDMADFVPKVWTWTDPQAFSALEGFELPHAKDIFDFEGLAVAAGDAVEAVRVLDSSEFATKIKNMDSEQAARTDDASIFKQDVEEVLSFKNVSEGAAALIQLLAQSVVNSAESAAMGETAQ